MYQSPIKSLPQRGATRSTRIGRSPFARLTAWNDAAPLPLPMGRFIDTCYYCIASHQSFSSSTTQAPLHLSGLCPHSTLVRMLFWVLSAATSTPEPQITLDTAFFPLRWDLSPGSIAHKMGYRSTTILKFYQRLPYHHMFSLCDFQSLY
jgi:hypothetical protein